MTKQYRNGKKSTRMITGEERSRSTNRGCPMQLVVKVQPGEWNGFVEVLECGHVMTAALGGWHPGQGEAQAMVNLGKRRRCRECRTS